MKMVADGNLSGKVGVLGECICRLNSFPPRLIYMILSNEYVSLL